VGWKEVNEVMDLIKRTAHTPGEGPNPATGYGVVDPVAALTHQLAPANGGPRPEAGTPISGPPQPDPGNARARLIENLRQARLTAEVMR